MASPEAAGDDARRSSWAVFPGPEVKMDGALRGELVLDVVVDRNAP